MYKGLKMSKWINLWNQYNFSLMYVEMNAYKISIVRQQNL